MTLQDLVEKLGAKKSGSQWIAHCPAHDDTDASLSLTERDAKIFLHCFANCTPEAICSKLNISRRDLFPTNGAGRRVVGSYDYVDESGSLLYQNVRYEPKDFSQRRPDGRGGWIWSLGNVRRVPYRLPEVLSADFVLIVEGEKDCETARALGIVATSSKNWRPEFAEFVRGKDVAIIADADVPGRKIASAAAETLTGKVRSLKMFELPGSKDLSEWAAKGGTGSALLGFIGIQPEWKPETTANWRDLFHTFADFENAPPLSFAIKGFVQNDAATVIGGLAGHDKTWILLSVTKALLRGKGAMLWNYFEVAETAARVLYLIPESSIGPFGHRLKLMGLLEYVRDGRLLVRTLSKGPRPSLSDPRILVAAQNSYVMLDTVARFTDGDENSAAEFQTLASDIFALLAAGARGVEAAHHAPKSFAKENTMSLEGILRGSGDIGAVFATAWGVKQLDKDRNVLHIENLKARDFEPCQPFQLAGRPYLDQNGDFAMHREPGTCGPLQDEQQPERDKGGAPAQARENRAANKELLRRFLCDEPSLSSKELSQRFLSVGITIGDSAIRKYRKELGL